MNTEELLNETTKYDRVRDIPKAVRRKLDLAGYFSIETNAPMPDGTDRYTFNFIQRKRRNLK